MSGFAIYRLPHANYCTKIEQTDEEPAELLSCIELNDKKGFVIAPFEVKESQPILLIRPDRVERIPLDDTSGFSRPSGTLCSGIPNPEYAIDFANFHAQLEAGAFRKIVLARCAQEQTDEAIPPMELFRRACCLYPRMFISLAYTKRSGWWLTATPEILLEGEGPSWRTIALAGTMQLKGEQLSGEGESLSWTTKNIQEQRYVTTYITECLEQFTSEFHEEGPITVRAANLVHLRSDFNFTLPDTKHIGDLLHALHPTPAVCGLPKRDAFRFIVGNEHTPRCYYSGFMGPLLCDDTHLYVSLRCMNIDGNRYHLYAGGGLLKDSVMEMEWNETEAKLETMRSLLVQNS